MNSKQRECCLVQALLLNFFTLQNFFLHVLYSWLALHSCQTSDLHSPPLQILARKYMPTNRRDSPHNKHIYRTQILHAASQTVILCFHCPKKQESLLKTFMRHKHEQNRKTHKFFIYQLTLTKTLSHKLVKVDGFQKQISLRCCEMLPEP